MKINKNKYMANNIKTKTDDKCDLVRNHDPSNNRICFQILNRNL